MSGSEYESMSEDDVSIQADRDDLDYGYSDRFEE
jgi:hypothetical protein